MTITFLRKSKNIQIHDVVAADRAIVHDDVPGPQGDGIPLLDLETLFGA